MACGGNCANCAAAAFVHNKGLIDQRNAQIEAEKAAAKKAAAEKAAAAKKAAALKAEAEQAKTAANAGGEVKK